MELDTETRATLPAVEQRGGDSPDWANARPGEELPELPGPVGKRVGEFLDRPDAAGTRRERPGA